MAACNPLLQTEIQYHAIIWNLPELFQLLIMKDEEQLTLCGYMVDGDVMTFIGYMNRRFSICR